MQNANILKYDISIMKKDIHDQVYLPTNSMFSDIINDVLNLNPLLEQASGLSPLLPHLQLGEKDIVFYSENSNPDVREFCFFTLNPNTPSGKKPKYPFKLHFYCKGKNDASFIKCENALNLKAKDCVLGKLEYMEDMSFGKIHVVIWDSGKCYTVDILNKKGVLVITKIMCSSDNKVLYKH